MRRIPDLKRLLDIEQVEEWRSEVASSWNAVYLNADTPWDQGEPEPTLVGLVDRGGLTACRALDIGCGPGNEALFLASRGFDVVGIDIASEAIRVARRRKRGTGARCRFTVADALALPFGPATFDVALDKACFHFVAPALRRHYAKNVQRVVRPGGQFILFASSPEDVSIVTAFKFTKEMIEEIFADGFRLVSARIVTLAHHRLKPRPYLCILERTQSA